MVESKSQPFLGHTMPLTPIESRMWENGKKIVSDLNCWTALQLPDTFQMLSVFLPLRQKCTAFNTVHAI